MLLFVSGLFCAPSITATVDTLSRLVPLGARGEAIGWHGSSMTLGIALGAPLAGFAIDAGGWQWGFVVVSAVGLARRPSSAASSSDGAATGSPPRWTIHGSRRRTDILVGT